MSDKKLRVYLASGWFTPATRDIRDKLENILEHNEEIELYSPLRDGIRLNPNQRQDTLLRESIFNENISHIKDSDLVVANIYSGDSYNDTGTMYEIGYAMANDVPVLGFSPDIKNIEERFKGILKDMHIIIGYDHFINSLGDIINELLKDTEITKRNMKILFVGNDDKEVDEKIVSYILDSNFGIRWVDGSHEDVSTRIEEIFSDIDFMIAVIDDRKTLMSWMIGQAYSRKIPVVTYSNHNYGINVMLLVSVLTHIRGNDELISFLQQVNRYGLESIPKFDISQLESM